MTRAGQKGGTGGLRGVKRPEARPEAAGPRPSSQAFVALGAYAKTRLTVHALGGSLALDVPGDVFSTQRIDEGTQLLLGHLPAFAPESLFELGCGYGALGLPIAAHYPALRALLVDRDLLAVAASAHNARALGLANVTARPSLGYRGLLPGEGPFDWVLCNVPARIGASAIGAFLEEGRALLTPRGELRVVVIRDLGPVTQAQGQERGLPLVRVVDGPRHTVFALAAASGPGGPSAPPGPGDDLQLYRRDQVRLSLGQRGGGQVLALERPQDVSEDPGHAEQLGLLFETFPRAAPRAVFTFRAGFGGAALAALALWPESRVVSQERDLLEALFLRKNAGSLGFSARLEVREALFPREAGRGERFDFVAGEVSPSAGPLVLAQELKEAAGLLAPGGEARVLVPARSLQAELTRAAPAGASFSVLMSQGGTSVVRLAAPRR